MLELKNVSVSFSSTGYTRAVKNVSLNISEKKNMILIGETGSGKSVLLQAILRLLPPTAIVSGEIILGKKNLLELSEKQMQKIRGALIGYIPQGNAFAMNPLLKIGFQVGESLIEHKGMSKYQAFQESIRLLERFELGNEKNLVQEYPYILSGGMRQRVMIAMGIAAGAPILLADEPTKGLDQNKIFRVVHAFQSLHEQSILCVTHDLKFAQAIGDQICVMYAANQMEIADNNDFFSQPLHPYSQALLNSQPEKGLKCDIGFAPSREHAKQYGCIFSGNCPQREARCQNEPPMITIGTRKVRCWKYVS